MVDTGATVSTTGDLGGKPPPLSTRTLTTMGFSGTSEVNIFTQPLQKTVLGQTFCHSLHYAPKCPTHLLGRDVLSKLNCNINCNPGGTMITSPPDGPWAHPLTSRQMVAIQEPPQRSPPMDIYWLQNMTTPVGCTPIQDTCLLWKAWILQQGDYHDSIDLPHTTLNATTVHDDVYQEARDQDMEGTSRSCTYREIYLGPEGVAAATILDTTIDPWFHPPAPHLTLAVASHYEAKNLGPMIARALAVQEWIPMNNPAIHIDPTRELTRISLLATTAKCVAEHMEQERTPGPPRPTPDEPEDPEVKAMLDSLPNSLGHRTLRHGLHAPAQDPHSPQAGGPHCSSCPIPSEERS